jgi:hypothetical protein
MNFENHDRFETMVASLETQKNADRGKWLVKTIVNQDCDRTYIGELIKFFVSTGELVDNPSQSLAELMRRPWVMETEKGRERTTIFELYPEKGKLWSYGYLQRLVSYLDTLPIKSADFYRHVFDVCEYLTKKEQRRFIWRSIGVVGISVLPIALLFIIPLFLYPKGEAGVEGESGE